MFLSHFFACALAALFFLIAYALPASAQQGDIAGSADPSVLGRRFPGARIVAYEAQAFDEHLVITDPIALYGIPFDINSATIKPESDETIAEIAKLLTNTPIFSLLVVGHTDDRGNLSYNQNLSHRRAQAVVDRLASAHGIDAARLEAHRVGYLAPVASNDSEEGRALNRHVVLVPR